MFTFLNFQKQIPSLGQLGEKAAATYLRKIGYRIIALNFTNTTGRRLGEIDIIAKDGQELVFVEVKTRKEPLSGKIILPEENINRSKLFKFKKIVDYYLKTNNLWDEAYRFDEISLIYKEDQKSFKLKHLKNIFL